MSAPGDFAKRELGAGSQMALEALSLAIWKRSETLIIEAERLYESGRLTSESAQSCLIGLLEQRKLVAQLTAQATEGVRAARRIEQELDTQATSKEQENVAQLHGRNRFTRSKVPPPPAALTS